MTAESNVSAAHTRLARTGVNQITNGSELWKNGRLWKIVGKTAVENSGWLTALSSRNRLFLEHCEYSDEMVGLEESNPITDECPINSANRKPRHRERLPFRVDYSLGQRYTALHILTPRFATGVCPTCRAPNRNKVSDSSPQFEPVRSG